MKKNGASILWYAVMAVVGYIAYQLYIRPPQQKTETSGPNEGKVYWTPVAPDPDYELGPTYGR